MNPFARGRERFCPCVNQSENREIKMSNASTFLPVAKLKGRENYTTWKIAVENLLNLDGLWKAVLGTKSSKDKIAKAKAKIVLSVGETLYMRVAKATTAEEVWKNLRKAFEDKGLTRKVGCYEESPLQD